jgi:DNA repair photolyase
MIYRSTMGRAAYIDAPCKSALNRVQGMPFSWSLNPYRGCVHACHYCYARATHAHLGLNADEDFETRIFVKTNLPEVLRRELARPSWRGESVAIGTATDPYQPAEGRFRITRGALEALYAVRNPLTIVTKSTLVQRDIDILSALAPVARVRVHMTITTLDPALSRLVEPGTPPPAQRLATLRRLSDAGIPTGVSIAPILPGITDSAEAIEEVAAAARAHGATALWGGPLRLAPLVKEHYFGWIAATHPDLLDRYERAYRAGANAPRAHASKIEERVAAARARHGFTESESARHNAESPARPFPDRAGSQLVLPHIFSAP